MWSWWHRQKTGKDSWLEEAEEAKVLNMPYRGYRIDGGCLQGISGGLRSEMKGVSENRTQNKSCYATIMYAAVFFSTQSPSWVPKNKSLDSSSLANKKIIIMIMIIIQTHNPKQKKNYWQFFSKTTETVPRIKRLNSILAPKNNNFLTVV